MFSGSKLVVNMLPSNLNIIYLTIKPWLFIVVYVIAKKTGKSFTLALNLQIDKVKKL